MMIQVLVKTSNAWKICLNKCLDGKFLCLLHVQGLPDCVVACNRPCLSSMRFLNVLTNQWHLVTCLVISERNGTGEHSRGVMACQSSFMHSATRALSMRIRVCHLLTNMDDLYQVNLWPCFTLGVQIIGGKSCIKRSPWRYS